jgi:putative flippase GtrA
MSQVTPPWSRLVPKFSRFVLVGGLCTAAQWLVLILLTQILKLDPTVASTIGFLFSAVINYPLNYSFTFLSATPHRQALPRFLLIMTVGLVLNAAVTFVGTTVCGVYYLIAQAMATGVTLIWNFSAHHRWSF